MEGIKEKIDLDYSFVKRIKEKIDLDSLQKQFPLQRIEKII